jgi:N-acetylglucosaminyl-diphospho-decaprenol L-rhamnosyltransferase
MPAPRVSIVIVNWKTPELLAECLNTLKDDPQHDGFELWVVDNNSGDDSVEMLGRDYPHIKVLANNFNAGFSKGCNQVIPLCTAPYIMLLNPDTKVQDRAVSKLADYLDTHPNCGAVGPKVLNYDGTLQHACRRAFPDPAAAFYRVTYLSRLFPNNPTFSRYNYSYADPDAELEVDALSGSAMMVRNEVVKKIGLLDEDIFMFGEDIDWCWRIKQTGCSVNYYPEAVVYHIHGAASRFRPIGTTIDLHKGMHVFYKKHLAQKYWAPFNLLVYAAIWSRAAIFVVVNWLRAVTTSSAAKQVAVASAAEKLEVRSGNLK